jgi:hypothetical protein
MHCEHAACGNFWQTVREEGDLGMKRRGAILVVLAILVFCSTSRANITNVNYASDGDGVFACSPWSIDANTAELTLPTIYGDYGTNSPPVGTPGHLILNVLTDSPDDPTLKISNSIENDSTFAWTEFTVNLYMAVPFTVTNVSLSLPVTWSVVSGDNQTASLVGGQYKATVVYDTGAAIPADNVSTIDFGYWVKFSGSPSYTITQEMIPVPEPGTLGLVGVGMLLFVQLAKRRGASRG